MSESQTKEDLERQLSDLDFKSRRDIDTIKTKLNSQIEKKDILESKLDKIENDMKEMQFKYHEVKQRPLSDEDLEMLAKKIKQKIN